MSVKVPGLMHFRLRAHGTELVFAAGRLAIITVVAAGVTAGFFAWFFIVIPRHSETLSTLGLPLALCAGALTSLWAWLAYGRYFAALFFFRF